MATISSMDKLYGLKLFQNKLKESQIPKERLANAKKYKEELKKSESEAISHA